MIKQKLQNVGHFHLPLYSLIVFENIISKEKKNKLIKNKTKTLIINVKHVALIFLVFCVCHDTEMYILLF